MAQSARNGDDPQSTWKLHNTRAVLLASSGRGADATEYFEWLVEYSSEQFGLDHANTQISLSNLALAYIDRGVRLDRAKQVSYALLASIDRERAEYSEGGLLARANSLGLATSTGDAELADELLDDEFWSSIPRGTSATAHARSSRFGLAYLATTRQLGRVLRFTKTQLEQRGDPQYEAREVRIEYAIIGLEGAMIASNVATAQYYLDALRAEKLWRRDSFAGERIRGLMAAADLCLAGHPPTDEPMDVQGRSLGEVHISENVIATLATLARLRLWAQISQRSELGRCYHSLFENLWRSSGAARREDRLLTIDTELLSARFHIERGERANARPWLERARTALRSSKSSFPGLAIEVEWLAARGSRLAARGSRLAARGSPHRMRSRRNASTQRGP